MPCPATMSRGEIYNFFVYPHFKMQAFIFFLLFREMDERKSMFMFHCFIHRVSEAFYKMIFVYRFLNCVFLLI